MKTIKQKIPEYHEKNSSISFLCLDLITSLTREIIFDQIKLNIKPVLKKIDKTFVIDIHHFLIHPLLKRNTVLIGSRFLNFDYTEKEFFDEIIRIFSEPKGKDEYSFKKTIRNTVSLFLWSHFNRKFEELSGENLFMNNNIRTRRLNLKNTTRFYCKDIETLSFVLKACLQNMMYMNYVKNSLFDNIGNHIMNYVLSRYLSFKPKTVNLPLSSSYEEERFEIEYTAITSGDYILIEFMENNKKRRKYLRYIDEKNVFRFIISHNGKICKKIRKKMILDENVVFYEKQIEKLKNLVGARRGNRTPTGFPSGF